MDNGGLRRPQPARTGREVQCGVGPKDEDNKTERTKRECTKALRSLCEHDAPRRTEPEQPVGKMKRDRRDANQVEDGHQRHA